MKAVLFPETFVRPESLADWLELTALHAHDGDASIGDLERELVRLSHTNHDDLLGSVLTEFDRREAAGQYTYPFARGYTSVQLKDRPPIFPAYFFCLALSYHGWTIRRGASDNPWLLFEELACVALKNYLGGEAVLFGTSSRVGRKARSNFRSRIEHLVRNLGEGECFTGTRTFSSKDSKLDVVAWKPFPDRLASQIVIFGQCAAGANWTSKLSELDPDAFWDQWMSGGRGKVSQPIRSVFMPHRVFDVEQWELRARCARLLFDRCRVVRHAHEGVDGELAQRLANCCRTEWGLPI